MIPKGMATFSGRAPLEKGAQGGIWSARQWRSSFWGETVDIHCGGVDNLFPHHENEIAQSEGCTGKTFVHHWIHAEHLIVEGRKMSKSLGNFFTLRQLLDKGYTSDEVRYLLLNSHYRMPLNFTFEGLAGARHAIDRLTDFTRRLGETEGDGGCGLDPAEMLEGFKAGLADDLNISTSLAALFDFVRQANAALDTGKVSKQEATKALDALKQVNKILDIIPFEEEGVPAELEELALQRERARKEKNWSLADTLRDKILAQGYLVEDTPKGPRLKRHVSH